MLSAASDGLESTRRQELGVMKVLRVLSRERPLSVIPYLRDTTI